MEKFAIIRNTFPVVLILNCFWKLSRYIFFFFFTAFLSTRCMCEMWSIFLNFRKAEGRPNVTYLFHFFCMDSGQDLNVCGTRSPPCEHLCFPMIKSEAADGAGGKLVAVCRCQLGYNMREGKCESEFPQICHLSEKKNQFVCFHFSQD